MASARSAAVAGENRLPSLTPFEAPAWSGSASLASGLRRSALSAFRPGDPGLMEPFTPVGGQGAVSGFGLGREAQAGQERYGDPSKHDASIAEPWRLRQIRPILIRGGRKPAEP